MADDLPTFLNSVSDTLNGKPSPFSANSFCKAFGAEQFVYVCENSIPWGNLRIGKATVISQKLISTAEAFVTFSFQASEQARKVTLNAVQDKNRTWKLDLDNSAVWDHFTATWGVEQYAYGELRFATKLADGTLANIKNTIEEDHAFLSKQLGSPIRRNLNYYFVNSQEIANQVGIDWSSQFGGGARSGFMLFVGGLNPLPKSILLHELVHEYTAHSSDWLKAGVSNFSNAFLSEGLAMWFQIPRIDDDLKVLPEAQRQTVRAAVLHGLAANLDYLKNQSALDLLDNSSFRDLDAKGYHPAYYVAAAAVDFYIQRYGIAGFKQLWIEASGAKDPAEIRQLILRKVNAAELQSHVSSFISNQIAHWNTL